MGKYLGITLASGGEPYYISADNIKFVEQTANSQVKIHYYNGAANSDQIFISVTNGPDDYTSLKDSFILELARILDLKDGNFQNMNLTFDGGQSFAISSVIIN